MNVLYMKKQTKISLNMFPRRTTHLTVARNLTTFTVSYYKSNNQPISEFLEWPK